MTGSLIKVEMLPAQRLDLSSTSALCRPAEYLCWSKMHAEGGQQLAAIISRKERERRACKGTFFWGVGNAPSSVIGPLARLKYSVPVIFSIMKSKPKPRDTHPTGLLVWRKYFDVDGVVRDLPAGALVTSRAHTSQKAKTNHFALACYSRTKLKLVRGIAFDPAAYRNASGGMLGYSQVTALVQRFRADDANAAYEENLRAKLTGSYWVKLADPILLPLERLRLLENSTFSDDKDWLEIVGSMRKGPSADNIHAQSSCLL